jgi:predicted transcriptional regulator
MSQSFNIVFPFQKIDQSQRIVTGIATADNVDYEDDRIDFEGSLEAFSNWIGNIREMHSPIAVGKLVDYRPVPVFFRGKSYQGIEVSVYISKGAEDTWEKILDGTLKGFSIGGRSTEVDMEFDEELQRRVRVIKQYILGELSVVDNPCNPAGLFTMIKRMPDGTLSYESEEDDGEDLLDKAISDINLTPTDAMAAAARRGLEWRQEYNRGGTAVGVARARDIANKKTLSPSTVRRMKSFFARHEVDKQATGWSSGEDGFPSAGRIAWELWGGEPGKSWANAKDAQLDREEQKMTKSSEERVFFCEKDSVALVGEDNHTCPSCSEEMKQIGFTENFDQEVIDKMVFNFLKKGGEKVMDLHDSVNFDNVSDMDDLTEVQKTNLLSRLGGLIFGDGASETVASAVPSITVNIDGTMFSKGSEPSEEVAEESAEAEVAVDDTDAVEETTADESSEEVETQEVEKSIEAGDEPVSENEGGVEMDLNEVLEKFSSVLDEKLDKVKADITAEVDEKIAKSVTAVEEATSETIDKLNDEVEKIADSGAVKKSVDADDSEDDEDVVEKSVESFWGGRFVPTPVVKALGYES